MAKTSQKLTFGGVNGLPIKDTKYNTANILYESLLILWLAFEECQLRTYCNYQNRLQDFLKNILYRNETITQKQIHIYIKIKSTLIDFQKWSVKYHYNIT